MWTLRRSLSVLGVKKFEVIGPKCRLFHGCRDIRFINLCQAAFRKYFDAIELQIPFVFFGALVVGAAVLLMANSRRELVLLGGVFLVGLTTLQMSIALGGF